ncbi:T10O22.17 [Arabidopsis thaliana]|uniref:T10O22.17 n=1 Tax=Arabidopsis thaliana TaxID=3702 RepID=Q9LM29_ARATH|nr:T10O22.17 [Arabidopsis thaliana]
MREPQLCSRSKYLVNREEASDFRYYSFSRDQPFPPQISRHGQPSDITARRCQLPYLASRQSNITPLSQSNESPIYRTKNLQPAKRKQVTVVFEAQGSSETPKHTESATANKSRKIHR